MQTYSYNLVTATPTGILTHEGLDAFSLLDLWYAQRTVTKLVKPDRPPSPTGAPQISPVVASPSETKETVARPLLFTGGARLLLQQRREATTVAMEAAAEAYVDECKKWLYITITWACYPCNASAWTITEGEGFVKNKLTLESKNFNHDSPEALLLQKKAAAAVNDEIAEFDMHVEICEGENADGRHVRLVSRPAEHKAK